jgi:hypothetical protein
LGAGFFEVEAAELLADVGGGFHGEVLGEPLLGDGGAAGQQVGEQELSGV